MANMAHTYITPGTAPSALFISMVSLMGQELVILMYPVRKVTFTAFAGSEARTCVWESDGNAYGREVSDLQIGATEEVWVWLYLQEHRAWSCGPACHVCLCRGSGTQRILLFSFQALVNQRQARL